MQSGAVVSVIPGFHPGYEAVSLAYDKHHVGCAVRTASPQPGSNPCQRNSTSNTLTLKKANTVQPTSAAAQRSSKPKR